MSATPKKPGVFFIITGVLATGIALGVLNVGRQKGGFLTTTDVGELEQFAKIQEQLRPLDACSIHYALRDKRGTRRHFDAVFVEACSRGAYDHVVIRVPETWGFKNVGFEMTRGGVGDRWEILVEKNEVPFADLVAALEDLSPRIAAEYPKELARVRAQMENYDRDVAQRRAADEARKQGAAETYPK